MAWKFIDKLWIWRNIVSGFQVKIIIELDAWTTGFREFKLRGGSKGTGRSYNYPGEK